MFLTKNKLQHDERDRKVIFYHGKEIFTAKKTFELLFISFHSQSWTLHCFFCTVVFPTQKMEMVLKTLFSYIAVEQTLNNMTFCLQLGKIENWRNTKTFSANNIYLSLLLNWFFCWVEKFWNCLELLWIFVWKMVESFFVCKLFMEKLSENDLWDFHQNFRQKNSKNNFFENGFCWQNHMIKNVL